MPASRDPVEGFLARLAEGAGEPLILVRGDRVLAEPAAERVGRALAARAGCEVEVHRRPAQLAPLLADLRTFSLFASAKVIVAVETAVLADRSAAAALIEEARQVLPIDATAELAPRERLAASRLLQALRLWDLDPFGGPPESVIARIPEAELTAPAAKRGGGKRGRAEAAPTDLRAGLAALLAAAAAAGMQGWPASEVAELGAIAQSGLPAGHALVLAESSAAADHPLVKTLAHRGALLDLGRVAAERSGGWHGLAELAAELERTTGAPIASDALAELARRTLRQGELGRGSGDGAQADSTERFAAEYRKLAALSDGGRIEKRHVEDAIEDRGQEDVWQLLDAIGAGRAGDALARLDRLLEGAEDPIASRLAFLSLLASFCRNVVAVSGAVRALGLPEGERNYGRFKSSLAASLRGSIAGVAKNPLAKINEYPLFKAYVAAARLPAALLAELPWRVLETELRLKGEGGEPGAALAELVLALAAPAAPMRDPRAPLMPSRA